VIADVYLSVGLSAGLHKKLKTDLAEIFREAQLTVCKILVVIGIGIQTQDWIFGFFTNTRYRKKSLSAGLQKKLQTDLAEISREG